MAKSSASKNVGKPKSRSKMTREKKKMNVGKVSKQEKKFHRKVKFNIPLKRNTKIFQKNGKNQEKEKNETDEPMENEEEEFALPLDMLSDDELQPVNINPDQTEPNDDGDEDDDTNEQLESYERVPRSSFQQSKSERPLLPIKTDRGQLISQSVPIVEQNENSTDDEDEEGETKAETAGETEAAPEKSVSMVELMVERQKKLDETKQLIVTLCDTIMKSPYEEISHLKRLRELLSLGDPLISMTVRKLTMLSLVELFRDIVPGYRIRSLKETAKDDEDALKKAKNAKQMKKEILSKDVKVIRHFEQTLLKHYQFFIHFLEQCAKKNLGEKKDLSKAKMHLGQLAVQCLCKLLTYLHHFNFRSNLIETIVQFMTNKNVNVQEQCCSCLASLIRGDRSAALSLEIVRFINRLLKTRSYAVEPRVLDVFLSLNIREISPIEEKKEAKASREDYRSKKLSRRERRLHKEKQELNKVLENKTLTERQNQRLKINRQIIELIFLNYFRLLKRRLNLRLMPSVCEGLAKFANLINIEYMDDLISCFYDELTAEQTGLTQRAKFHCLITVFSILNRQEVLIHIDPQRFYALFYSQLFPPPSDNDIDLVIRLVQLMLLDRYKQLTKNKLLAFVKRLATMVLHLQTSPAISAVLVMIKALLTISPLVTESLFDNELLGSGIQYLSELNDPEYCNAQNATLYELILLKKSSDKNVREQVEEILTGKFQSNPHVLRSCEENALAYLRPPAEKN